MAKKQTTFKAFTDIPPSIPIHGGAVSEQQTPAERELEAQEAQTAWEGFCSSNPDLIRRFIETDVDEWFRQRRDAENKARAERKAEKGTARCSEVADRAGIK